MSLHGNELHPIEIRITADNAEQARIEMGKLLGSHLLGKAIDEVAAGEAEAVKQNLLASQSPPPEPGIVQEEKPAKKAKAKKTEVPAPVAEVVTPTAEDEPEPAREPGQALTHDDVRNALGKYVNRFGIEAAQADGPKVITLLFGEGKVKVSDIPDNREALAKAIAGVEEMLAKNPYARKEVA